MEFYQFLKSLSNIEDLLTLCLVLLSLIVVTSTLDWLFGWLNAKFNKEKAFVSEIALYGIVKKMMYFMVLVLFLIIALIMLPESIAYTTILALYVGFLWSEVNSLMSHFGLTEDGKKGALFIDFIKNVFNREERLK